MQKFFLIGIKGAGMSALARILHAQGHEVFGSDITEYVFTEAGLVEAGITILPFQTKNFEIDYDVIIRGSSFNKDNNIEVAYLAEAGVSTISYYDFLNQFLTQYRSFAVTGTHGKTTTTGLIAKVIEDDRLAYLIGDGTGDANPNAEYFIFESCEYKRHFLAYFPDYAVITNIEYDHPDYYQDLTDVIDAFSTMVGQTRKKVIAWGDDDSVQAVIAQYPRDKFITFGFLPQNDFYITDYVAGAQGVQFSLRQQDKLLHRFQLPFYGKHMVLNALPAIIIGRLLGKAWEDIVNKLQAYEGVKRRFHIESFGKYTIVDDYAHHPTEIAVTLAAIKQKFPDKKIVTIFQPHTFTRTEALNNDFIAALSETDVLYVTDIFASARETGEQTKPVQLLSAMPDAKHLTLANIRNLTSYDQSVLVFMGAGNIQNYVQAFKESIRK